MRPRQQIHQRPTKGGGLAGLFKVGTIEPGSHRQRMALGRSAWDGLVERLDKSDGHELIGHYQLSEKTCSEALKSW